MPEGYFSDSISEVVSESFLVRNMLDFGLDFPHVEGNRLHRLSQTLTESNTTTDKSGKLNTATSHEVTETLSSESTRVMRLIHSSLYLEWIFCFALENFALFAEVLQFRIGFSPPLFRIRKKIRQKPYISPGAIFGASSELIDVSSLVSNVLGSFPLGVSGIEPKAVIPQLTIGIPQVLVQSPADPKTLKQQPFSNRCGGSDLLKPISFPSEFS